MRAPGQGTMRGPQTLRAPGYCPPCPPACYAPVYYTLYSCMLVWFLLHYIQFNSVQVGF